MFSPLFGNQYGTRDTAISIKTGCGLDGREVGVRVPEEVRFFSSPRRPDRFWALRASYPMGNRGSLPVIKATAA
jgi:hypothetical protein